MRGLWAELTDLVLSADCAGCGLPRAPARLCADCRAAVEGSVPRRVRPAADGLPAVWAAAGYHDEVRAALLAHKERGALPLAGPLGAALARAVRAALRALPGAAPGMPVVLLSVPSARRAVAARGHDPVRRLTRAAAADLRAAGVPARALPGLRQVRRVADQAGLTVGERAVNLDGALELVPGAARAASGAAAVLVDDVMTTGASLREAARAARCGAVWPVAGAVVACRDRR